MKISQSSTQEEQKPATPRDATNLSGVFRDVAVEATEIRKAANDWFETRIDAAKIYLRRAFMLTALGIALLVAILSAVATIVVMFLNGIAIGIGLLLGGRLWLGQILTALGIVITLYVAVRVGARRSEFLRQEVLIQKYELRGTSEHLAASTESNATTTNPE